MEPPLPLSFPLSPHSAWTISSILLTCIQPMLMILKSVSPGLDFRIQLLTWLLLFPVLEEPQTCHGQAWTPTFPTVLLLFIPHHPIGLTFPQIPRNWATPLNIILPLHVVNRQVMLCPLHPCLDDWKPKWKLQSDLSFLKDVNHLLCFQPTNGFPPPTG